MFRGVVEIGIAFVVLMALVWAVAITTPPYNVERLGWVCGAAERLDGSEYRLFICGDTSHEPEWMVHVDQQTYDKNVRPMGMGYPK